MKTAALADKELETRNSNNDKHQTHGSAPSGFNASQPASQPASHPPPSSHLAQIFQLKQSKTKHEPCILTSHTKIAKNGGPCNARYKSCVDPSII